VLDHPLVQARLHLPADQFQQRPERQVVRSLYDCPEVPVGPEGVLCRVVVATHPAGKKKSPVGVTRAGWSTNSFSPTCREPRIHRLRCRRTVSASRGRSRLRSPMRIGNKTRIAGAATQPGGRSAGKWCRNGCGTSAWNEDTNFILILCVRPSLLLPSHLPPHTPLPLRAMLLLTWECPGNLAASRARILFSNRMGRCGAPPTKADPA
jgi:hypothetical protein